MAMSRGNSIDAMPCCEDERDALGREGIGDGIDPLTPQVDVQQSPVETARLDQLERLPTEAAGPTRDAPMSSMMFSNTIATKGSSSTTRMVGFVLSLAIPLVAKPLCSILAQALRI